MGMVNRSCVLQSVALAAVIAPMTAAAQPGSTEYENRLDPGDRTQKDFIDNLQSAPAAPATVEAKSAPSVVIRGVQFVNTDAPAAVGAAAEPFLGETATLENIKALTDAMTAAYQQSAVALFTIVVPEQDFAHGVVRVYIAEGYIEKILLTGEADDKTNRLVRSYADKLMLERPLQRATMERQLSLIRDIPGLSVKTRLLPGSKTGAVRLQLALDYKKPTVTFGFSNRTTRLVADGQFTAQANVYRLLRDGDKTQLNMAASVNFNDSLYAGLEHSTPLGGSGLRAVASGAWLRSQPTMTSISGDAQIYSVALAYPVLRSYKTKLIVSSSLDLLNSDNAALGAIIASERTRAGRLKASYNRSYKTRSVRAAIGFSHGLDMIGARTDTGSGNIRYKKLNGDFAVSQRVHDRFVLRASAAGQWSADPLPANERFAVGGAKYGRGFKNSIASADRGAATSLEVAWRPVKSGVFAKSEIYAFTDYAQLKIFARPTSGEANFDLGSAGGGVRAAMKDIAMLEMEFAKAYDVPANGFADDWRFSVRWKVTYRP